VVQPPTGPPPVSATSVLLTQRGVPAAASVVLDLALSQLSPTMTMFVDGIVHFDMCTPHSLPGEPFLPAVRLPPQLAVTSEGPNN
jgi:hypothetical protein